MGTCYGGRNRKMGQAFVETGKSMEELEEELLGGQKSQGPETAAETNFYLKQKGIEDKFPMFTAVHKVCIREMSPTILSTHFVIIQSTRIQKHILICSYLVKYKSNIIRLITFVHHGDKNYDEIDQ